MSKKSQSDLVSLRTAALRLRIGRASLTRIVEHRGIAPAGEHNGHPTYRLSKLRKALGCRDPSQMSETERGAHWKAERLKHELETMLADLCPRVDHEAELVRIVGLTVECFKGVPDRVKDLLPEHALARVKEALDAAGNELQRTLERLLAQRSAR